tara:strand:- start:40 stop:585 length:546 start_codon:yes stop_codon:yes gene_type:complete
MNLYIDFNELIKNIKEVIYTQIKENNLLINSKVTLVYVSWKSYKIKNIDKFNYMIEKLGNKIKFNYMFDYINIIPNIENNIINEYNIKSVHTSYKIKIKKIELNQLILKSLINNKFKEYINDTEKINNEEIYFNNMNFPEVLCFFIDKKIEQIYNLDHIHNSIEAEMLANILSNKINLNIS